MYTILGYLWQYISNPKVIIALSLLIALISSYQYMPWLLFCTLLTAYLLAGLGFLIYWLFKRYKNTSPKQDSSQDSFDDQIKEKNIDESSKAKLNSISQQLKTSLQLIRKSKLGNQNGHAALYQLPWYMLIGSPAAGKSSAIYHSGLKFPFKDHHQATYTDGLAGTQQCDWFFATEGVLLDTAGRYSVYAEAQPEWLGFLNLLKKSRSKAPINGLIILVNIVELISQSPDKTLKLAHSLRSRIQEITERLEISTPIYVVFSKMDLVAGFTEFFECFEETELNQVWGASIPYHANTPQNVGELFEQHYNILYEGLKSTSTTHLSRRHANNVSPNIMTFPLEFKSLSPVLKLFINTLFEDNPYQFKPVFRGFYFTSSLQQGAVESPMTALIAQEFGLNQSTGYKVKQSSIQGIRNQQYFLKNLFTNVIFKDKDLVKQHINPQHKRQRYLGFISLFFLVSVFLAFWLWSYRNNQQLIADVQVDLNKVVQMESGQRQDLLTHLNALLILQQRLQQLDDFDQNKPLKFSLGLYQGEQLRERLKIEYLNGIKKIILLPTQQNMAEYLQRVNNNAVEIKNNQSKVQIQLSSSNKSSAYFEPSDSNPQDAYNALKGYLMLGNKQYAEEGHLRDQITRFWRLWLTTNYAENNSAEIIQKTEQILTYATQLVTDKAFPVLQSDPQLVDQSRQVLLTVVRGMPARERVYNDIKMRAAVRFPSLTVAQIVGDPYKNTILGGYAISGVFSQKAWDEYIAKAIDEAANTPIESKDWVLNVSQSDDLSFTGSPDQIRQQLTQLYKQEYIAEWHKFLGAIYYAKAQNFAEETKKVDALAEPQNSPIRILVERIAKETSWDNPAVQAELATPKTGFIAWFKRTILRQDLDKSVQKNKSQAQGQISQSFNVFYQLIRKRDDQQNRSLLDEYLQGYAQVRSQFNQLKTSGDIGPSALTLVKTTINEQKSVFNSTQKIVDEKLSVGLNPVDQQIIQKLFMSPLTQAFDALLIPAQNELNKLWITQTYQPFNQTLSSKYPFNSAATIQATSSEISQIFGENGSISHYVKVDLDPLIIRRGYNLTAKTWQNLGISLSPQFIADFKTYVAPTQGLATGQLTPSTTTVNQSNFQFFPLPNKALLSYSIEIDGQRLFFDNGIQQWISFVWPNPNAIAGAKITAIDLEGKVHTILEAPGEYGINHLIDTAQRIEKNGIYEMTWISKQNPQVFVKTNFRLISGSGAGGNRGYTNLKLVDHVTSTTDVRIIAAQTTPTTNTITSTSVTSK